MSAADFTGWIPIRIVWRQGEPHVDWCRLGAAPLSDPFFDQTIGRALSNPAQLLFRRQSPLANLEREGFEETAVPPTGFIFHLSRCGSTLVAQMLAALSRNIVVSEAQPLDDVLGTHWRHPGIPRPTRVTRLRAMVHALGQPRRGGERHYFIKFDSWHALELSLLHEAFPTVPWIFLYRDPVEVLVSHQRQRGSQALPGVLDPRMFGLDLAAVVQMSLDEYCARILSRIAAAAVAHAAHGRSRFVNFTELPDVVGDSLDAFFDVAWSPGDRARMREVSLHNAKIPSAPHVDDRAAKQREASADLRRLGHEWFAEVYEQLEALRGASADMAPDESAVTAVGATSASGGTSRPALTAASISR